MNEAIQINVREANPLQPVSVRENELVLSLEALKAEMNQFTYIVSHDLQAPLRMVTGFLELLVRRHGDKLDESANQFINQAIAGAAKMKDLVTDLLEYSRLNTIVSVPEEISLEEIIMEAREKLAIPIAESGAIIMSGALPMVIADRKQMVVLFTQLLDNAIKFRNGQPKIQIEASQQGNRCFIRIKDNSAGIEPAFFDKIFIVFRKLQADEKRYPGTGIGLALCKKIVELHGGTIGVESKPGEGSVFFFSLPMITTKP